MAMGPAEAGAGAVADVVSPVRLSAFLSAAGLQAARAEAETSHIVRRRIRGSGLEVVQRGVENFGVEPSCMKGAAGLGAGQPHFRRAEEQGVDLIEVTLISLEDLVEGRAIVA